ncbi:MAG: hypothetical protein PHI45_01710 [Candidatus Pacebacteria bacterium]|jgi:hypothetical protein|nr:hypothetical protein [Candidatus Paceibacterota bacterium]MDD5012853.1 hypothetical protein [Candidatus Paceibacterota bacterium]MDD5752784.1 hypothetical protein [Candidatus Paceibacterota bacterium]
MEFRQSLFWDVDPKLIDINKNANYVIERILDFGNDEEVKWVWKNYDKLTIKRALESSRSLRKESKNLWNLILEKK